MRPAFSNALYYPTIDIRDTRWLRTAALFWDSISTIVPETCAQPYESRDARYLADSGFLRPLRVDSRDRSVLGIEDEAIELFSSERFARLLRRSERGSEDALGGEMPSGFRQVAEDFSLGGVYSEKMSHAVQERARAIGEHLDGEELFHFNGAVECAYMLMLANRLCEDNSLGLITDDAPAFNAGNLLRLSSRGMADPEDRAPGTRRDGRMEQGLLLNLVVRDIAISPDTPLERILDFKKRHRDELGRFRTELARLTQDIETDGSVEDARRAVRDLYDNAFLPAYDDLKAALRARGIQAVAGGLTRSLCLATGTGLAASLLHAPEAWSLALGAAGTIAVAAVDCFADRSKLLRENPYSYLLSVHRELEPRTAWPERRS